MTIHQMNMNRSGFSISYKLTDDDQDQLDLDELLQNLYSKLIYTEPSDSLDDYITYFDFEYSIDDRHNSKTSNEYEYTDDIDIFKILENL